MKLISFLLECSRSVKYSRLAIAVVAITGIISGVSNIVLLALITYAIKSGGNSSALVVWGFIGFCLLLPLTRFISQFVLTRLTANIVFDLRIKLCRQVVAAPLSTLEKLGPHRILAILTDDIPVVTGSLVSIPHLGMHLAIVIACLIYLAYLSWVSFLGVLAFMVVGVLTYYLPIKRAGHHFKAAREEFDGLFKHFRALTGGTKELKLHTGKRESFMSEALEPTASSLRRYNVLGSSIFVAASSWGQALFFILIGMLLFVAPRFQNMVPDVLVGYTLTILYMMTPLEVILNLLPTMSRANVAVRKIEDLGQSLSSAGVEGDSIRKSSGRDSWRALELKQVTTTYYSDGDGSNFTLGPIDLTLYPGELLFLAGGNGSGKTTLAKLLMGLYAPESGEIRLDSQLITDQNRESYRQLFSAVFSDFFLFEKLFGLNTLELNAEAQRYLARLQLDHKVEVKDGVFSTTDLSQGQRKRLALLSAYLEDRSIYVFDEWAADQDPMFKRIFYFTLLPELKARGKAVLVITHDEQYYHVADRIIKLDYGKIQQDYVVAQPNDAATGLSVGFER